jgi:hypothetical protein
LHTPLGAKGASRRSGFVRRDEITITRFVCALISTLRLGEDATAKTALPIFTVAVLSFAAEILGAGAEPSAGNTTL